MTLKIQTKSEKGPIELTDLATPRTTQFLTSLYPKDNLLWIGGEITSLYDRIMENRAAWKLISIDNSQVVGKKHIAVRTYELPDGSIRYCFDKPKKIIGFLLPGEAVVINERGSVEHGVRHKI